MVAEESIEGLAGLRVTFLFHEHCRRHLLDVTSWRGRCIIDLCSDRAPQ